MDSKKVAAVFVVTAASAVTAIIAFKTGVNPPMANVAGSFAAIAVFLAAARLLKVRYDLFYFGLIFIYFASPVGSVLNMYRRFGPYDKIIHFISGILLASFGFMIISKLLEKAVDSIKNGRACLLSRIFFAFFFSSACAGIWEIFEFVTDKLSGGGMQRGMVDTVTDIIAGNVGALAYCVVYIILIRAGKINREIK